MSDTSTSVQHIQYMLPIVIIILRFYKKKLFS